MHSRADAPGRGEAPAGSIAVSAKTGEGLDALWARLGERAGQLLPPTDDVALNRRQRDLCALAARAVREAVDEPDLLLVAEHFRSARQAFDAVTGRADVEAMLDALFARFCIGK